MISRGHRHFILALAYVTEAGCSRVSGDSSASPDSATAAGLDAIAAGADTAGADRSAMPPPDGRALDDATPGVDTIARDGVASGDSFSVTAELHWPPNQPVSMPRTLLLTAHFDEAASTLVVGVGGGVDVAPARRDPSAWTLLSTLSLDNRCGGDNPLLHLRIETLVLRSTATGVSGEMTGSASVLLDGDMLLTAELTAGLTGVADTTPPLLDSCSAVPLTVLPTSLYTFRFSEPLPERAAAQLLVEGDSPIALSTIRTKGVATGFETKTALAFDHRYRLEISAFVDLAGNPGDGSKLPSFSTPKLGLAAQDGFEGAGELLAEKGAAVVDATVLPPISGNRSLYLPGGGRFVARLAVRPGQTTVRATVRGVLTAGQQPGGNSLGVVELAVPGGAVARAAVPQATAPLTELPGQARWLAAPAAMTLHLPAGVTSEVMISVATFGPSPVFGGAAPGLLLDDLRVE